MSMKSRLACLAMAALVSAPLLAGTLTVVQPNGGETFTLGETKAIRWTAVAVSQNVRINLLRGTEVVGTIVSGLPAGGGYYHWQVGQLTDGTAPPGGNYRIRVRAIESTEVDQSDGPFSISVSHLPEGKFPPSLKVEQPNGGESWRLGTEHEIKWASHFQGGKVMLQLYRAAGSAAGLIADEQPASGSYSWKAGKISSGYVAAGQYKVRVVAKDNHTVNDMSDEPIALTPSLADVVKPGPAQLPAASLPGIYAVFTGQLYHPDYGHYNFSQALWQQAFAAFQHASCTAGGANATARVGVNWFYHPDDHRFMAAAVECSRIHFNLQEFAGKGNQLASAKLKLRRIHVIDQDAGSSCPCSESIAVLQAAMTSYEIPGSIGQNFPLPYGQEEFDLDITGIVKEWLNGSLANHGLVLLANDLPCAGGRLCTSCFEASLVLKMN